MERLLTYIDQHYTISVSEVLFLYGLGIVFLLAAIGYVYALVQSPVKYTYRRRWVEEDDLYEVIK